VNPVTGSLKPRRDFAFVVLGEAYLRLSKGEPRQAGPPAAVADVKRLVTLLVPSSNERMRPTPIVAGRRLFILVGFDVAGGTCC
jgi:hypothetical protein